MSKAGVCESIYGINVMQFVAPILLLAAVAFLTCKASLFGGEPTVPPYLLPKYLLPKAEYKALHETIKKCFKADEKTIIKTFDEILKLDDPVWLVSFKQVLQNLIFEIFFLDEEKYAFPRVLRQMTSVREALKGALKFVIDDIYGPFVLDDAYALLKSRKASKYFDNSAIVGESLGFKYPNTKACFDEWVSVLALLMPIKKDDGCGFMEAYAKEEVALRASLGTGTQITHPGWSALYDSIAKKYFSARAKTTDYPSYFELGVPAGYRLLKIDSFSGLPDSKRAGSSLLCVVEAIYWIRTLFKESKLCPPDLKLLKEHSTDADLVKQTNSIIKDNVGKSLNDAILNEILTALSPE